MKHTTVMKIGAFAWILWFLICVSALGGLIYVAVHFISKYW